MDDIIGSRTRLSSGTATVEMFKGNLIVTLQANDQTKLKAQDRRGSTCPCQMVSFSPRLANDPRWPRRRSGIWQNPTDSSSLQFKNLRGDKNIDQPHKRSRFSIATFLIVGLMKMRKQRLKIWSITFWKIQRCCMTTLIRKWWNGTMLARTLSLRVEAREKALTR